MHLKALTRPPGISIISGALAGVLGLTSYSGFAFYLLTSVFAGLTVNLCNASLKPANYFRHGFMETATQGLTGNLMAYLLCESAGIPVRAPNLL